MGHNSRTHISSPVQVPGTWANGAYKVSMLGKGMPSNQGLAAAAIKTAGGAGWTMSTAANAIDIVTFLYDGTNLYAVPQQAWA